ncbi:MAG: zinc ribbon domain-containing protein, partial [Thermodesulfovibrionales bacterium]|nr:zinc ribbon domain-containing protein [Thermodesulfovibrionales bacterium]
YECLNCGEIHEARQKFSDKPLSTCTKCGGTLKKIVSNTSFILKGTGWYKTDYASKPAESGKKSEAKKDSGTEPKTETKADAQTKADTKTDAAAKA